MGMSGQDEGPHFRHIRPGAAFDLVVDLAKGTLDVEEIAELLSLRVTD